MSDLVVQHVPIPGGFLDIFDDGDFVVHAGEPSLPETQSTYYGRGQGPPELREPVDRFLARRAQASAADATPRHPAAAAPRLEEMYAVSDPRGLAPSARLADPAMSAVSAMDRALAREVELRQPVPYPSSGGEVTTEELERSRRGEGPPMSIAGARARRIDLARRYAEGTLSAPDLERESRSLAEQSRRVMTEARARGYRFGEPWPMEDVYHLAESLGLAAPFDMPDQEQLRRERYVQAQVAPLQVMPPPGAAVIAQTAWISDFIPIMAALNDIYRVVTGVDPTTSEALSTGQRRLAGGFVLLDLMGLIGALLREGPRVAARAARAGLAPAILQRTYGRLQALEDVAPAVDAAVRRAQAGQRLSAREIALVEGAEEATRELRQAVRQAPPAPTDAMRIEGMGAIPGHLRAVAPDVARRAMAGRRASAGRSGGFGRIDDAAIGMVRLAARRAGVPFDRARRSLGSVHDDVIRFINGFHGVPGFEHVLADYLRGGAFQQGARYVMQFVEANVHEPAARLLAQGRLRFEVPRGRLRRMDAVIANVRYEFKSVREFRPYSSHAPQLRRDLADLLAQMPDSPEHLRWVFDANRLGMDRTQLVTRMQETVRRSFGSHPRAEELAGWIETIVTVW